jgi:RNA polymerase sigma factor (sigma-70 family)
MLTAREVDASDQIFANFYSEHAATMLKFAYLMVGNDTVAEDLAQDAFIAVYLRFDRLETPAAYLRMCIVNGATRRGKREQTARSALRRFGSSRPVHDHPDELQDALLALPERQRAALFLKFYLDLPEREIAGIMGCRPGTVKSTLHAARKRLAEVLP